MYEGKKLCFGLFGVALESLEKSKNKINDTFGQQMSMSFSEKDGATMVEINYREDTPKDKIDEVAKAFVSAFSDEIFADTSKTLLETLFDILKVRSLVMSSAESFTGGAIAKAVTSVPGASEVFYEGLVCYNANAKIERLGVSADTVREKTVVSSEVAFQMVRGLLGSGNCDVAVATTGYASPTGDKSKPCGLCYIGAGAFGKVNVSRYQFKGTREQIAEQGKNAALFALIKILKSPTI